MNDQRKDLLIQQFEEAALGLLMEDYADAEGARLLQDYEAASRQDAVAPMPEELDTRCQKIIDQAYEKHNRRRVFSQITKAVGRVAVVALVIFGLTSFTVLSVDAWRVPVLNLVMDKSGRFSNLVVGALTEDNRDDLTKFIDHISGVIPLGYELTKQSDPYDLGILLVYRDKDGGKITVDVSSAESSRAVDTENAECTYLEVGGHQGILIEKGRYHILWYNEIDNKIYGVLTSSLSEEEFWEFVYGLAAFNF